MGAAGTAVAAAPWEPSVGDQAGIDRFRSPLALPIHRGTPPSDAVRADDSPMICSLREGYPDIRDTRVVQDQTRSIMSGQ